MVKKAFDNSVKRRYKMYKAGKSWLYAPLLFISLGAGMYLGGNQVHADTNGTAPATVATQSAPTVDPVTPVDQQKALSSAEHEHQGAKQDALLTQEAPKVAASNADQVASQQRATTNDQSQIVAQKENQPTEPSTVSQSGEPTTGAPVAKQQGTSPFMVLAAQDTRQVTNADELVQAINDNVSNIVVSGKITFNKSPQSVFNHRTVTISGGTIEFIYDTPNGQSGSAAWRFDNGSYVTFKNITFEYTNRTSSTWSNIAIVGGSRVNFAGTIKVYDHMNMVQTVGLTYTDDPERPVGQCNIEAGTHFIIYGANDRTTPNPDSTTSFFIAQNMPTTIAGEATSTDTHGVIIEDGVNKVSALPIQVGYKGIIARVVDGDPKGKLYAISGDEGSYEIAKTGPFAINGKVYCFYPGDGQQPYQMITGKTTIPGHDFTYDFGADGVLNPAMTKLATDAGSLLTDLRNQMTANPGLANAATTLQTAIDAATKDMVNANVDGNQAVNDYDALQKAINGALATATGSDADAFKQTTAYTNYDHTAYDAAVKAGTDFLADPANKNATPAQIQNLLDPILAAKKVLIDQEKLDQDKNAAKQKVTDERDKAKGQVADPAIQQQIDDAAKQALKNIDGATDPNAVTKAQNDGVKAIDDLVKTDAKNGIDDAATKKKAAIDQDKTLTTEEKNREKGAVDDAANAAKKAIDDAPMLDDVKKAAETGKQNIDNVKGPETPRKVQAEQAIKAKRDALNNDLNNDPTLTPDQKNQLTGKVNADADAAIKQIKGAADDKGVDNAKNDGLKDLAKDSIKAAEQVKNNQIDNDPTLTTDEKNALKGDDNNPTKGSVAQAVDDALKAIDNATDPAAIDDATTKGETAIKNVPNPANPVRSQAKDMIAKRGESIKNQIDQMDDLTPDEKTALKGQVDADVKKAQEQIDAPQTKTNTDVTKAVDNGLKDLAKDLVKAAQGSQHNLINKSNLTNEEKKAKNDSVDGKAESANKQIDRAPDANLIKQAGDDGVDAIKKVVPGESVKKQAAIEAINQAKQALKDKIDNDPKLTGQAKDDLKQRVQDHADTAIKAINDATTNQSVDDFKVEGLKNLAEDAIERAEESKRAEVKQAPDLTTDEVQALNKQASDEAIKARTNITKATTPDDIVTARDHGVTAIEGIQIPTAKDSVKGKAKASIDDAYNQVIKAINDDKGLTPEQKQALTDEANTAKKTADDAIAKAATEASVKTAVDNGLNDLGKVKSKQALDDKLNEVKHAVDAAADNELTPEQKQDLKADADQQAETAKKALDDAKKPEEVKAAETTGLANLDKTNDKAEIRKAQNEVTDFITEPTHQLTPAEQTDLTKKAQQAADDAIKAIDDAQTKDAVTTAKNDGLMNLDRNRVKAEIKSALNENNADIDNDPALTPAEKDQLKSMANKAVEGVDQAIDAAKDQPALDQIKNATLNEIDKSKAMGEIMKAKDQLDNRVDQDQHLTASEKQALKDAVKQDADGAMGAISHALNKEGLDDAVNRGLAKLAVRGAEITKRQEIADPSRQLTPEEQATLVDQVNAEVQKAMEAIDQAQEMDAVNAAKEAGVTAILGIAVPDHSKDAQDNGLNNGLTGNGRGDGAGEVGNQLAGATLQKDHQEHRGQLPQTGDATNQAGVIGLAMASLFGLIGLTKLGKRDEN